MAPRAVPVSVPGKLFVLGEYAVLAGGAALVTCVDRHIHIRPRSDRQGYRIDGANLDDPIQLPLIVKRVLAEEEDLEVDPNCLTVDLGEFFEDGTKLGIGSSAASTVGLISSVAFHLPVHRRFELAWEVHRRFQGGRGSGADIAASTFGGTLAFHLRSLHPPFDCLEVPGLPSADQALRTEPALIDNGLELPENIRIDAVWTGQSARSMSFIDGLRKALEQRPEAVEAILKSISSRTRKGIQALRDGNAEQFLDAVRKGDRLMERLGALLGLPIITDTHRRIRALASTTGRIAKPSGAGGGDFTLLAGPADSPVPPSIEDNFLVLSVG